MAPAALLLAALSGGCDHVLKPQPEGALLDESRVVNAVDASIDEGSMLLLEDGLWALLDTTLRLQEGELLSLEQPSEPGAAPQLFAVLTVRDWGAMLQRLSRAPFKPTPSYTVARAPLDALTLERHGARRCQTAGEEQSACGAEGAPPSVYYRLAGDKLAINPAAKKIYTLPLLPELAPSHGATLAVALPHAERAERLGFIAAIEARCDQAVLDALTFTTQAEIVRFRSPEALAHPLDVEVIALELGADVIVSCPEKKGRWQLITPQLARPWLPSHQLRDSPGPLMLSAAMLDLPQDASPQTRALLIEGAALAARGQIDWAGALFEVALGERQTSRAIDAYAAALAQVIAVRAPEQAIRITHRATRNAWRRDQLLEHNLVMIAAWNALGQLGPSRALERELPERAASQRGESRLASWTLWRSVAQRLHAGALGSVEEIATRRGVFPKEQADRWHLMMLLSLLFSPRPPGDLEVLDGLVSAIEERAALLGRERLVEAALTPEGARAMSALPCGALRARSVRQAALAARLWRRPERGAARARDAADAPLGRPG